MPIFKTALPDSRYIQVCGREGLFYPALAELCFELRGEEKCGWRRGRGKAVLYLAIFFFPFLFFSVGFFKDKGSCRREMRNGRWEMGCWNVGR
jgi:hypothetical protein